ncbi:hypothetical protein V5T82_13535 [Magnetovibrio sp. PR-2]|uniref:hypothetical protein n=1 Tax=Magnetovibrio sp. PR-2 TaxID=3120356 RepID=UPI002FCE1BC4
MTFKRAFLSVGLILATCLFSAPFVQAAETNWAKIKGEAIDLAVGLDGTVFSIDEKRGVKRLTTKGRQRWMSVRGGTFVRVVGNEDGRAIGIQSSDRGVYLNRGSQWKQLGNLKAVDLAQDQNGSLIAAGVDGQLWAWDVSSSQWFSIMPSPKGQRVMRLDIQSPATYWVVADNKTLYRLENRSYTVAKNNVIDVVVSSDRQSVLSLMGDGLIERLDISSGTWTRVEHATEVRAIAAGTGGNIWHSDSNRLIFHADIFATPKAVESDDIPVVDVKKVAKAEKKATKAKKVDEETKTPKKKADKPQKAEIEKPQALLKPKYTLVSGTAAGLSVGADGRVFAYETGGNIFYWSNSTKQFESFPGTAKGLIVDEKNKLWAVTNNGVVSRFDGKQWKATKVTNAIDVALAPDGTVFATDQDEAVFAFDKRSNRFRERKGLSAFRMTFDHQGGAWLVRKDRTIYHCKGTACRRIRGEAEDIFVTKSGLVLKTNDKNELHQFDPNRKSWTLVRKKVRDLAIGPGDMPWMIDMDKKVYASAFFKRDESKDQSIALKAEAIEAATARSSAATSTTTAASTFTFKKNLAWEEINISGSHEPFIIFVGTNNSAFVLTRDSSNNYLTILEYDTGSNKFKEMSTSDLPRKDTKRIRRMALDPDGRPWLSYLDGELWRPEGANDWKQIPASKVETGENIRMIGINADNVVVGVDPNGVVHEYNADKDKFAKYDNADDIKGGDLAVRPDGYPWTYDINDSYNLYAYTGSKFEKKPSAGQTIDSIGFSSDGSMYVVEFGYTRLLKWNDSNESFDEVSLPSGQDPFWVSVAPDGRPWIVTRDSATNSVYTVYRAK